MFLLTAHRTSGHGDEVMAPSYGLLDLTVYGRRELWEDSPEGWPQRWGSQGGQVKRSCLTDSVPLAGASVMTARCGRGGPSASPSHQPAWWP